MMEGNDENSLRDDYVKLRDEVDMDELRKRMLTGDPERVRIGRTGAILFAAFIVILLIFGILAALGYI